MSEVVTASDLEHRVAYATGYALSDAIVYFDGSLGQRRKVIGLKPLIKTRDFNE